MQYQREAERLDNWRGGNVVLPSCWEVLAIIYTRGLCIVMLYQREVERLDKWLDKWSGGNVV